MGAGQFLCDIRRDYHIGPQKSCLATQSKSKGEENEGSSKANRARQKCLQALLTLYGCCHL